MRSLPLLQQACFSFDTGKTLGIHNGEGANWEGIHCSTLTHAGARLSTGEDSIVHRQTPVIGPYEPRENAIVCSIALFAVVAFFFIAAFSLIHLISLMACVSLDQWHWVFR